MGGLASLMPSFLGLSLRSLGVNIVRVAKSQTRDARSVAAAPAKLFCATRSLVPKLAEHVSPMRLVGSLVKEVNDSLEEQFVDVLEQNSEACSSREPYSSVMLPTEEALREHDEEIAAQDAASAAAAVLKKLPLAKSSGWSDQSAEWCPQVAYEDSPSIP